MRIIQILIFFLFINLSWAGDSLLEWGCPKHLKKIDTRILSEYKTKNYQVLLWKFLENGNIEKAQELENSLYYILSNSQEYKKEILDNGAEDPLKTELLHNIYAVKKKQSDMWLSFIQAEVAVYLIDRIYSFHLTPLTILREIDEVLHSFQYFFKDTSEMELYELKKEKIQVLTLFDLLIRNSDRHSENLLISTNGRIVAIDHGLTLKQNGGGHMPSRLLKSFFKTKSGKRLLSNLKSVPDDYVRKVLKPFIGGKLIEDLLVRKNRIIKFSKSNKDFLSYEETWRDA